MNDERKAAFFKSLIDMFSYGKEGDNSEDLSSLSRSISKNAIQQAKLKELLPSDYEEDEDEKDLTPKELKTFIEENPAVIPALDAFFENMKNLDSSTLPEGTNFDFKKISEQYMILKDKFDAHQESEDIKNF